MHDKVPDWATSHDSIGDIRVRGSHVSSVLAQSDELHITSACPAFTSCLDAEDAAEALNSPGDWSLGV